MTPTMILMKVGGSVRLMTFGFFGLGCPVESLAVRCFRLDTPNDRQRRFGLGRYACQRREA